MINTPKLLAFSGSLRNDSWNHKLVCVAADAARKGGAEVTLIRLSDYRLPLLNQDDEPSLQTHPELLALRALFSNTDGLLIASPEYNGSLTPSLKNTLDWMSRPAPDGSYQSVYPNKVVGLLSASPGGLGGIRGLNHLRDILTSVGSLVVPQQMAVNAAHSAFSEEGVFVDETMNKRLEAVTDSVIKIIKGQR
ncbi:MAG: NAD(P)H-dependent oxidoreductase [Gammaproteobacteria bacterium]|nr:NAD(P)H-dependent oxidoreductase [Gammaproteobacteria bacterium]